MDVSTSSGLDALPRRFKRGLELTLRIESFDARGRGAAVIGDVTLHAARALPGEVVRCSVLRKRGAHVEARVVERIEPSAHEVAAPCRYSGTCGGCSFQNLSYIAQLEGLRRLVEAEFVPRGLLAHAALESVIPARDTFAYRNKMEFTFSNRRWVDPSEPESADAGFALGLHPARLFRKVIDVESCAIQDPRADAILGTARRLAVERALEPWDTERHVGLLRHFVLRVARATGEILVNLVTAAPRATEVDEYAHAILASHPEITTLVHTVNRGVAETAVGESERVLRGNGTIRERIGELFLSLSAQSFFQTNTAQAEHLYAMVAEESGVTAADTVFDLYCGAGSIGLWLAKTARQVVGFEVVSQAVRDARENARLNRIENALFIEGDVLSTIQDGAVVGAFRPRVCIVDPPRAGLHPRLAPKLLALAPERIVYVSCNPESAARDLEVLCRGGYAVRRVRPIDMFPHTPHVECVIRVDRVSDLASPKLDP